jgi:cyclopropane-fatty-acyl-phospholipid synthase
MTPNRLGVEQGDPMATQEQITATYDFMDETYRLAYGEHADVSAAMYNGDWSLSLEEAQAYKHRHILEGINFKPGHRVLDIGCGWGPILNAVHLAGGKALGLTLSPAQAAACQRNGYEAQLLDCMTVDAEQLGSFDAVVAMGPMEHLCSIEDFLAGKQEEIYRKFFASCASYLPVGGRLYLQTMIFGKTVPDPRTFSVHAPQGSDEWVMGLVTKFYPGSWLPAGIDQIVECASGTFKLISENNGRLDYIETMKQWTKRLKGFSLKRFLLKLKHIPRYFRDPDFKYQLMALDYSANRLCFEREIMSHQRMFFEKIEG